MGILKQYEQDIGGVDSSIVDKIGSASLKTTADNLSDAVNELVDNTATKEYVDTAIDNLPEPMIYKGTLGTGGTITTLPNASTANEGYTYKVITAGTYDSQPANVGDVFTSNATSWVLFPGGDTDTDTWRPVKVNGTEKVASGISGGAVDFVNGNNTTVVFDATGNKISINTNGTTYADFTGATTATVGVHGLVPAPGTVDTEKFLRGDGTWASGGRPMVILSYGNSTWNDFITAYNNNVIVYCRASSNSNPATGVQGRMAFMAYVNGGDNLTSVEFQYYRSVSSHTDAQQGDQVFIYKLDKTAGWTVTTRNAFSKVVAGENMTSSYNAGTITLNCTGGGGGSTVTVTPSLSSGTKVADYSIDGTSGSLYAPTNTDESVAQTVTSTNNSNYELLFSGTADNITRTEGTRKNSTLKCNPSTGNISVTSVSISGTVTNNTDAATKKYVDDSVGAAIAQVLNASY